MLIFSARPQGFAPLTLKCFSLLFWKNPLSPCGDGNDWCEVSHLSKPAPQCKRLWLMHWLPTCQNQRPNVNGYDWCEVFHLSKPAPQGKRLWLMHRLPTCQNQRPNVNGYDWCEVSHLSKPAPRCKRQWLMHRLPTCQNQRPNVNGYDWCEVSHLSKPAPQCKRQWLMHRLPTCQNQRPNVNGYEWCTHFFQKLHMNCASARICWFGPKKIWRHDLLDSLALAMNSFKKWCPWCDFSVVMWLEFFVVPATRDVTAAPWCELSRALVLYLLYTIGCIY